MKIREVFNVIFLILGIGFLFLRFVLGPPSDAMLWQTLVIALLLASIAVR